MGRPDASGKQVSIDLTPTQVGQVLRIASESVSTPSLLTGLGDISGTLAETDLPIRPAEWNDQSLSRSLLVGLLVLASLPSDGSYLRNIDVARKVGLSVSTTHRYLTTLVLTGLVERDAGSRRYKRLAPR